MNKVFLKGRPLHLPRCPNDLINLKFNKALFSFVSQQCLLSMGVTDASFVVKDKDASDVGKFLNRILGLSVERQNLVSTKILPVWWQ